MADHGSGAEQLVEAHLAVKDVAADQPEPPLEIERRMDLPAEHRRGEARRMGIDSGDDLVRRFVALLVPAPTRPEVIAKMLAEQAGDMLAFWRQSLVEGRGDQHLNDWLRRPAVALRISERTVHIAEA